MKRQKTNEITNNLVNKSKTIINLNELDFTDEALLNNSINSNNSINKSTLRLNREYLTKVFNKLDKRSNLDSSLISDVELLENKIDIIEDDQSELNDSSSSNFMKNIDNNNQTFKNDSRDIFFLLFLYFLQGIPLGLTGSLPFILSSRKVSYSNQGTFSFAFWPFSFKLLWAPIVDSIYFKKFGRRKSWLVPMQYLIGFLLILFSNYVHNLIELSESESSNRDIYILTGIFFVITFFAATQDIVVDGWALSMLSKENVAWASTCNSTGLTAGWFLGNVLFLVFQSADFSNKYIRPFFGLDEQPNGIVTINKFMQFFGVVFIVTTTLILFFKHEKSSENQDLIEDGLNFKETYKIVWKILSLSCVRKLAVIIFTSKIAFAMNSMAYLKLIEKGVNKESLGILAIPLTPLEIFLPIFVSRYTNGPKPLDFFIKAYPYRIIASGLIVILVYLTPIFKDSNNQYPFYYFVLCIIINGLHSIVSTILSVTQTAYFTRICDKTVGGTYMTFLNTISNIGSNWPATLSLYLVDIFTYKACFYDTKKLLNENNSDKQINFISLLNKIEENVCSSDAEIRDCIYMGGKCTVLVDAYYFLAISCFLIGALWLFNYRNSLNILQSLPKNVWKIELS